VLVADFDYELPTELIAQEPLDDRASSRMLVVHRAEGRWEDRCFRDIVEFVRPGDCLVLNESKVFPSRLFGTRANAHARIEVFLLRAVSEDQRTWQCLVRPGRKAPAGERIRFSNELSAVVLDRGEHGERRIRFDGGVDVFQAAAQIGHVPLPPYIRRPDRSEDRARYNTVFARETGSVAAPTAGLHFTPAVLDACRVAGASIARVTLHVGLGTFAPLHVERVEDVRLHCERYHIDPDTFENIRSARRRIAVGTTSVRTIESAQMTGRLEGETNLFIAPGFRFQLVDALLTNFHLPKSSLLMLVSAFGGRELILDAYKHAVRERYRFFSYGDCMLIL
jgi:S-adenosylmethionine:tRNA ribosyltransferase-isomerase